MKPFGACLAFTVGILIVLLHAWVNDAATKPLQLWVTPIVAFAPVDLTILIRLQPQPDDRALSVWMDGENFSRLSGWQLEGENSPKLFRVEWRRALAGEYDVTAAVQSTTGERCRVSRHVLLTAP